ncbi:MAG: sodium:solute symporter [Prolixibacteraceae bacterium]|jgi:SSS family solute:Na+ symporter|nr:sodium:solute symporter [Prolixibacteraceae bacterium]
MRPQILLILFIGYFIVLLTISFFTGRNNSSKTFFTGDRKSPWFIVAFGMVGATLSGVTFISVPGEVGNSAFHYLQFVMGNFVGYLIIALFLLPFYYKQNIVSIYTVLSHKMGQQGYLTTSGFFILSKIIGAAFRLYLAALVIYMAIAQPLGLSFGITVLVCLLLIWIYTAKSGIKTVVWSDMVQTIVLLSAVIATIITLKNQLSMDVSELSNALVNSDRTKIFNFDMHSPNNFIKQFISGIFITIALNGFDQDIIQKNLTCKNFNKAQKNMVVFSIMFIITVLIFLVLGALLFIYAEFNNIEIPANSDQFFPLIALTHLGPAITILFTLGISAAAFSSADSATTAMTTAFSVDFLKIEKKDEKSQKLIRKLVHLGFNLILFAVIYLFYKMNNDSVVVAIFKAAGYTYGPILGVFVFSFFIKRIPRQKLILPICILSPIITYTITLLAYKYLNNYEFGFELIIVNSLLTIILLTLFSEKERNVKKV